MADCQEGAWLSLKSGANLSQKNNRQFITGNQAVVLACCHAGVSFMAGYPITPATEILEEWAKLHIAKPRQYKFIQAEDEISAGFMVLGAILAGNKAFSATAGPGHILMQDPLAMAEAMRLPMVLIVMQRGGPSTGTVIYSQQEVTLACFGGNGEGLRIVYSAGSPQELYDYTKKALEVAWKYRFPSIVLGDGYSAKMKIPVTINNSKPIKSTAIFTKNNYNLRNCYNIEDELAEKINMDIKEFKKISPGICQSQSYNSARAQILIVAHGIVAKAAYLAVKKMEKNRRVGLFRPITLNPFDYVELSRLAAKAKKLLIIESAAGQLERIVKKGLFCHVKIETLQKPAQAISVEEIVKLVR